jgi:hypothetical protein
VSGRHEDTLLSRAPLVEPGFQAVRSHPLLIVAGVLMGFAFVVEQCSLVGLGVAVQQQAEILVDLVVVDQLWEAERLVVAVAVATWVGYT